MIYESQRDPRWALVKIGDSQLTLGKFGCTTTCLSMLSDYFGCFKSPDMIALHHEWYTPDGLIVWGALKFPNMQFVKRTSAYVDQEIQESINDPKRAVMLNVNGGTHWVVAIRKALLSNDYVCVDPWTGKRCLAKRDYHNIVGSAHFEKIPLGY